MKKLFTMVLIMAMVLSFSACGSKLTENGDGITGIWYEYEGDIVNIYEFTDDGKCAFYDAEYPEDRKFKACTFDEEKGILSVEGDEQDYLVEVNEDSIVLTEKEFEFTHDLYRTEDEAKEKSPYYRTSDEYLESIGNDSGWYISDGICYAYRGDEKEITIPGDVTEIYMYAFSSDHGNAESVEKVIVPGTVEKVDDEAFSFTGVDDIVFEEGVMELGDRVFMDSYVKKVYFAGTIEKIGMSIMETEEGLDGTEIYVKKDSAAAEYFSGNKPYGRCKVIEE